MSCICSWALSPVKLFFSFIFPCSLCVCVCVSRKTLQHTYPRGARSAVDYSGWGVLCWLELFSFLLSQSIFLFVHWLLLGSGFSLVFNGARRCAELFNQKYCWVKLLAVCIVWGVQLIYYIPLSLSIFHLSLLKLHNCWLISVGINLHLYVKIFFALSSPI